MAGLLLAGAGVRFVYWMDVATMAAAIAVTFLMGPQVQQAGAGHRPGVAGALILARLLPAFRRQTAAHAAPKAMKPAQV